MLVFFIKVIVDAARPRLEAVQPERGGRRWSGIMFGVLYGVLIFVGFETAANLAEETARAEARDPARRADTVVIVTVFYLIASYAQVAGFGFDVAVIIDPASRRAPLFVLGLARGRRLRLGRRSSKLIEVVVLLDILAVGLGAAVASTRGVFAMARDRRIPGVLAEGVGTRHARSVRSCS